MEGDDRLGPLQLPLEPAILRFQLLHTRVDRTWGRAAPTSPHAPQAAARDAVYANRRRIRGARGKRLLWQRGELLERPNAHLYETGRMRRVHLRGHPNILKRLLVQVCGVNLGLLMRHLTGLGAPRSLQGRASALVEAMIGLLSGCGGVCGASGPRSAMIGPIRRGMVRRHANTDTRFSIDNLPLLPRTARPHAW